MVEIPTLIYHGTTYDRYLKIKKEGMKCDIPRYCKVDNNHLGYLYFTESRQEAINYGFITYYLDKVFNKQIENPNDRVVVVAINTSRLRGTFLEDPEYEEYDHNSIVAKVLGTGKWWRYRGDIKNKFVFLQDTLYLGHQQRILMNFWKAAAIAKFLEERHPEKHAEVMQLKKNWDNEKWNKIMKDIGLA